MSGKLALCFLAACLSVRFASYAVATRFGIARARVRKGVLRFLTLAVGLCAFECGGERHWRENTGGGEVNGFVGNLLAHVQESRLEAGEFDFALVDVFKELVILVYLCFVFEGCSREVGETFLYWQAVSTDISDSSAGNLRRQRE